LFVGGEFYYDGRWMTAQPDLDTSGMYFLNGGQACLRVIGESLREMGFQRVLLPAYLCPSIIRALEPAGLQFAFYEVGWDLSINIDQAARMVTEGDAFYFINYFGFSPALSVQFFIRNLQQHGILVIEDNAQAGFPPDSICDFVFNSLRKLVPYDGGYLKSRFDLQPIISRYSGKPNRRLPLIRAYRQRLAGYLLSGGDDREELQALYEQAEKLYGTDGVVCGDLSERECIEHLDWKGIRQIRRETSTGKGSGKSAERISFTCWNKLVQFQVLPRFSPGCPKVFHLMGCRFTWIPPSGTGFWILWGMPRSACWYIGMRLLPIPSHVRTGRQWKWLAACSLYQLTSALTASSWITWR